MTIKMIRRIIAVATGKVDLEPRRIYNFGMRPEQIEAVRVTKDYFENEVKKNPSLRPKFLWNCKMRFGKTFTTYQLAKAMGLKKILMQIVFRKENSENGSSLCSVGSSGQLSSSTRV